jgi:phosphatidylserine synthase
LFLPRASGKEARMSERLLIVAFFVALTFVPIRSVHPVRVVERRPITMIVTALWAVAAIAAGANPIPSPLWVRVLLLATAAYLVGIGAIHNAPPAVGRMSLGRSCTGLDLQAI